MVQSSFLRDGGRYFVGGSRALTEALAEVVRERGGELFTRAEAVAIYLDDHGHAAGVGWHDEEGMPHTAEARVILGNAAPAALSEMLPPAERPRFNAPYADLAPSISLFSISLGVDRPPADFGVTAYSTFILPDWLTRFSQFPENAPILGGDPAGRLPKYVLADYSRVASGLNEEGLHLVAVVGVDRLSGYAGSIGGGMRAAKEASRYLEAAG